MYPLLLLAAALAPSAPQTRAEVDVAQDRGPQAVLVQMRQIPAGGSSGWHVHPGVEISTVLSGVTEVSVGTAPPRRVAAGETITIPSGVPHMASASADGPAQLILTFVVDKGEPLRTPVAAPQP